MCSQLTNLWLFKKICSKTEILLHRPWFTQRIFTFGNKELNVKSCGLAVRCTVWYVSCCICRHFVTENIQILTNFCIWVVCAPQLILKLLREKITKRSHSQAPRKWIVRWGLHLSLSEIHLRNSSRSTYFVQLARRLKGFDSFIVESHSNGQRQYDSWQTLHTNIKTAIPRRQSPHKQIRIQIHFRNPHKQQT